MLTTRRLTLAVALAFGVGCGPRGDVTYNPAPERDDAGADETGTGGEEQGGIDGEACPEGLGEGDPCGPSDGWCVLDWGQPCGSSQALWCRDGQWVLEQEANLCDEDRAGI